MIDGVSRKNAASHVAQKLTPASRQRVLARYPELAVLGSHRQYHGAGAMEVVSDPDLVQPAGRRELYLGHVVGYQPRPEPSAWSRKCCIISGPMIPSGNPG